MAQGRLCGQRWECSVGGGRMVDGTEAIQEGAVVNPGLPPNIPVTHCPAPNMLVS